MTFHSKIVLCKTFLLFASLFAYEARAQDSTEVVDPRVLQEPSPALFNSFERLTFEAEILGAGGPGNPVSVPGELPPPGGSPIELKNYSVWPSDDQSSVVSSSNVLFVMLDPDLDSEAVTELLADYQFQFVEAYPEAATIKVRADLSDFYSDDMSPSEWLAATANIIRRYGDDPRLVSATPDFAFQFSQTNALDPDGLNTLEYAIPIDLSGNPEIQDWGITDIQADLVWSQIAAPVLKTVGVFDAGFALHEDIPFINSAGNRRNDHGNHVAAIMCGLHNNKGIRGVLPSCGVYAQPYGVTSLPIEGGSVQERAGLMYGVMASFEGFVENIDDVSAYNVSLGYNWYKLEELDPDINFATNPDIRTVVQAQSTQLFRALRLANEKGVPIFSAAGNDSRDLDFPFDARWASPFNYAALTACSQFGTCNGIVVEAHNSDGKRAIFSNIGGDISCPGVNIESALSSAKDSYGVMSGTSMASPYCTAGFVLLSTLVDPADPRSLLDCALSGAPQTDSGARRLLLKAATDSC